jgi:hypothetical protein
MFHTPAHKQPAQFFNAAPLFGTLSAALAELSRMLRAGHAFSDAAFAAADNHGVGMTALVQAYNEEH